MKSLPPAIAALEVTFPGLSMGIFSGDLQFTVYKGTNLLRMDAAAKKNGKVLLYSLQRRFGPHEQAAKAAPKIQLVVALMLVPSAMLLVAAALVASLGSGG